MDKTTIANEFISRQLYAEATSFALDALAEDKAEEGAMQVRVQIQIQTFFEFKPFKFEFELLCCSNEGGCFWINS